MNLFGWLKFFKVRREPPPEVVMSNLLAKSIAEKAQALQAHLQEYMDARDPFGAMMADLYNRKQVARIWKNGSGL